MHPARSCRVATLAWLACLVAAPARAQPEAPFATHIRPEPNLRSLVAEVVRRSQTVRDLAERLERSDVTVYIRIRPFADSTLDGRVTLLSRTSLQRFLVVELACGRTLVDQMATLGHELRHAVEIADAPAIVDARTMIAHYQQIGIRTSGDLSLTTTFETKAAVQSGRRVWRELMAGRRTVDGS